MTFQEYIASHPEYKPKSRPAVTSSPVTDLPIGCIRLVIVVGVLVGLVMFFVAVL